MMAGAIAMSIGALEMGSAVTHVRARKGGACT